LKVLVDACNDEANLSVIGRIAIRQHLLELLVTRFRLFDYWRQTPQIQAQPVLPQIFITGLPKSGSTFLHRLLALDFDNRVPRMCEVMHPLPPPRRETFDSDQRIRKTNNRLWWLRWFHPDLLKAHPVGALIPQECGEMLGYCFESRVFLDMLSIPSYESWLRNLDQTSAYLFHSKLLKHLQWQWPAKRWVLKSSDHLHALKTLMIIYPEARFIFLHRYPLKVLQAVCSQMALLKIVFSRNVSPDRLGTYETLCLNKKIDMIMDFRNSHPHLENRVMDLHYRDLAFDPVRAVRAIYSHFGLSLSDESASRMEVFVAAERSKDRSDRFSLAHFYLKTEPSQHFDCYCERFGIGREEL
jgi:LPS sulfotransferase NodH